MSRLPEPGDAIRAAEALNARVNAAADVSVDQPVVVTGTARVNLADGSIEGSGADSTRQVYGDLMDVAEVIAAGGISMVEYHGAAMLRGQSDPMALVLQAVAFGVLMERLRWERGS